MSKVVMAGWAVALFLEAGQAWSAQVTTYLPIETETAVIVEGHPHGPDFAPPGRVPFVSPSPGFADEQARALFETPAQTADEVVTVSQAVLRGFPGLDQPAGGNYPAADTNVAKSSSRVLEAVNSTLRLFLPDSTVLATKDLLAFMGASGTDGIVFDPRVYFDRTGSNPRFYVVAAQSNTGQTGSFSNPKSRLWLAVSRSGVPSDLEPANWCRYSLNTLRYYVDPRGVNQPTFADFPALGVGEDTLTISDNQGTIYDPGNAQSTLEFVFALLRVFNKTILSNNSTSCPTLPTASLFQPATTYGDLNFYSLQAVQHYSYPTPSAGVQKPAYLLSTAAPPSSTYKVWRIRNVASGSPVLDRLDVTGNFEFATPPVAYQPGSTTSNWYLSTGPVRILQAAGYANSFWGVHTTACAYGTLPNESCLRAVRFDAGADAAGGLTATIGYQRTITGGDGFYYWMPSVAVDGSQNIAVGFLASSLGMYESFAFTTKLGSTANFAPGQIVLAGNCSRPPSAGSTTRARTGDYVGAQTNTDLASFWLAGEAAQLIGGSCQWGTKLIQVVP